MRMTLHSGSSARIGLFIVAAILIIAMVVFFVIGVSESGLNMLFKGNFFTPENLLAWQIPALRGIEVDKAASYLDSEQTVEFGQGPDLNAQPLPAPDAEAEAEAEAEGEEPVVKVEVVHLDPGIAENIKIEILNMDSSARSAPIDLGGDAPRILIYHTHTTEAYTQTAENKYVPSGDWRTRDNSKNVVALGERLARILHDEYGFTVLHDTTDHEPPKLATSYNRSLETMQNYKKKYTSINMFIDLHRDAYTSNGPNTDFVTIDGKRVARMMFVVGTGEGKTGEGFKERPDWKENYKLALNITNALNAIDPSLARPIRVKTGRYNQHVSNHALLVEVGHNENTFEEALAAMTYLAKAIASATRK